MGADTTSTHLIFFIAATVVAVAASGALSTIVLDLSSKASLRGAEFGDQLASDIKIVNDPANVQTSPTAVFYIKNTGKTTMALETVTVLVDGTIETTTSSLLAGESEFRSGAVAELSYTPSPALAAGDHTVRVVMGNGVADELMFRVS